MQLDIQYKVETKWHGSDGILCERSNLFPVLSIRYREKGSRKWIHLGKREIDVYTYHRFKNTYYKDFRQDATDLMTLETKSDYDRLMLFRCILDNEFFGSLDVFVKNIVEEDVAMIKADEDERKIVNRVSCLLETNGWATEQLVL